MSVRTSHELWFRLTVAVLYWALPAYILERYESTWLVPIINRSLFLVAAWPLLFHLYSVLKSSRLFGKRSWALRKKMLAFTYRSTNQCIEVGVINLLLGCALLVVSITGRPHLGGLSVLIIVISLHRISVASNPPLVLLLGASGASSTELQVKLQNRTDFHTTSLLCSEEIGFKDSAARIGEVRSIDEAGWRERVFELSQMVKLIVVDGRSVTDFLLEEVGMTMYSDFGYKLVVVEDDSGNCPLLDANKNRGERGQQVSRMRQSACEEFVWDCFRDKKPWPDRATAVVSAPVEKCAGGGPVSKQISG